MDIASLCDLPPWEWPKNAATAITRILKDRGSPARDRLVAANLAGELVVMDDRMAGLLLSIVESPDEPDQLRAKAAISLGPALGEADTDGFDDEFAEPSISEMMFRRICATIRRIYSDDHAPKEVRRRVLEAAVRAPQDWHRDAVLAAYSSDDEDWKLTAVFCMGQIQGFEEQILEMLESRNPKIQVHAIHAAGVWEVDEAWPHIAALLDPPTANKSLLLAAIEAAGSIRPREATEVLAELADSKDEEIAEAVSEALLMAGSDFDESEEEPGDEDETGRYVQ